MGRGGVPSAAYTPERAKIQWERICEVFMDYRPERGKLPRWKAGARLADLEARRRPAIAKRNAQWQWKLAERRRTNIAKMNAEAKLLQRVDRLLHKWDCTVAAERRRKKLDEARFQRQQRQLQRKRRWDGKEALLDFERRVRAGTASKGVVK